MNNETPNQTPEPGTNLKMAKMWSRGPWPIIALVLVVVAVIAVAVSHKPVSNNQNNNAQLAHQAAKVEIVNGGFFPSVINVKVGQAVSWTNQESAPHWVASDPYPKDDTLKSLNSNGPIAQNESYSYTFEKTGTYTYHDELHPLDLKGTVQVR